MTHNLLANLHRQGKPLVEIVITPANEQPLDELKEILNSLGPDIEVDESPYTEHSEISGNSRRILVGQATKEALFRLFGWSLARVEIPSYPGYFHWEERNRPQCYPPQLEGRIESMGFSEPGSADTGNEDAVEYRLESASIFLPQ
jgi:hypothetical protein